MVTACCWWYRTGSVTGNTAIFCKSVTDSNSTVIQPIPPCIRAGGGQAELVTRSSCHLWRQVPAVTSPWRHMSHNYTLAVVDFFDHWCGRNHVWRRLIVISVDEYSASDNASCTARRNNVHIIKCRSTVKSQNVKIWNKFNSEFLTLARPLLGSTKVADYLFLANLARKNTTDYFAISVIQWVF